MDIVKNMRWVLPIVFCSFLQANPQGHTAMHGEVQIAEKGQSLEIWERALSNVYKMKRGITLTQQVRGQLATGTLPVAEQSGLGGMNTVRSYYEQARLWFSGIGPATG